jgi:integrase
MRQSLIAGRKPRRKPRSGRDQTISEKVSILDGKAKLFRKPAVSGDVWQFHLWLKDEKKNFYRSTKTTDLEEAKKIADEMYVDIRGRQKQGIPVIGKRFEAVVEEWLDEHEKRIGREITSQRFTTIRTQAKHFIKYWEFAFGRDASIARVPKNLNGYYDWRIENHPKVVNETLMNEKSSFIHLFKFAVENDYLTPAQIPQMKSFPKTGNRRDEIDLEDYQVMTSFMRSNAWTKDDDPKKQEQKFFVGRFILFLSNYGLRYGEARRVRWEQVSLHTPTKGEGGLVGQVRLDANQTKNNKHRKVIGRNGEVFKQLRQYSNHIKKKDLLFVDNDTGEAIKKDVYYKWWHYLMRETGLSNKGYSFYSLRHSFATWRIAAGVGVERLSVMMGTDIKFIQDHYWHENLEQEIQLLTADLPDSFRQQTLWEQPDDSIQS